MTNDTMKGSVEALLLPYKDSHSLAYTLLPKARTIDQQIETLKARIKELEDELASSRSG